MTTERATPTTEAGRALLKSMLAGVEGCAYPEDDILAIEAESAARAVEGERRLDVERLAKVVCRLERDHDHAPYGPPDFADWYCKQGEEAAEDIATEYARFLDAVPPSGDGS